MNVTSVLRPPRRSILCLALLAPLVAMRAGSPTVASCAPFDLTQQLAQAASEPETRFLDVGTREARPYLLAGWSIDELWHDKTSFAWAMGDAATLRFTRFTPGPFTLYFRCRPMDFDGGAAQEVTILVNGAQVGVTRLEAGEFKTYQMAVPAAAVRPGENRMELRFARFRVPPPTPAGIPELRRLAVAWDWIGFGVKSAPAKASLPTSELGGLAAGASASAQAGTLSLPFLDRLDFFLAVQAGSTLRWQAIRPWGAAGAGAGAALEIRIDMDGAPLHAQRVEQGSFAAPASLAVLAPPAVGTVGAPGVGNMADVAAGAADEKPVLVRISFLAWPGRGADPEAAGLTLEAPRVLPPGCSEADGAPQARAGRSRRSAAADGPNVVLYMIDTLRADHLGAYGYPRPISPAIDAFAAGATVFSHAFAQSGWTKSSVASMLTGLHPLSHGVVERMDVLPETVRTLPEMLSEAGYETFGITTNPATAGDAGFARGFDRYVQLFGGEAAVPFVAQPSEKVDEALFRWLGSRDGSRPFFAYVHTMDVHEPYLPPAAWRQRFAARAEPALCRPGPRDVAAALAARPGLSRDGLRDNFAALYDAQIAHTDSQFGLLLKRLRELGLYDKTVIVLVSDHGEEFLDHGLFAHGHSLYQEILHVPMIVRWPDGKYAGRRVESAAQHVDLLPTILAAAGVQVPAAYPGMDLRLLAQLGTPVEREVSSDLSLAGTRISSLVAGGMHLLVRDRPNAGTELYDLRRDPAEQRNLADPASVRFGYLMSRLHNLNRTQVRLAGLNGLGLNGLHGLGFNGLNGLRGLNGSYGLNGLRVAAAGTSAPLAAERDRQLRSLGYVR
jgi:arylsulfatase A-like enzyme